MPIISCTQSQTHKFQDRHPTLPARVAYNTGKSIIFHLAWVRYVPSVKRFLPGDYLKHRWCSSGFILNVKQTLSFAH
jgi:hypothetical protein